MQRAPVLSSVFLDAAISSIEKAQDSQLFIKHAQIIGDNL
jgi:hypothetical protein